MIVVGLTGSLAMGKSETAKMFASLGIPVCDSDAVVHRVYAEGGAAVEQIRAAFPSAVQSGKVDRARLAAALSADPQGFAKLEAIVHPLVAHEQQRFLDHCRQQGRKLVVLDIPLL